MKKLTRWWKQHETVSRLSRAARRCLVSSNSREPSAQLKSSASNTRNKACHKAPAKVITMNVSGGNSKEIFELFTNKLVFSVSVSQRWRIRWSSWLAISSLDAPLERSASSRIIMKEFLFSIWFISLSSNLKLSIDIFIMSVRHVFADFRFIFVKCSCSRRDGTSLFSLFYKIILYIQGSRLRPKCDHFLRACE